MHNLSHNTLHVDSLPCKVDCFFFFSFLPKKTNHFLPKFYPKSFSNVSSDRSTFFIRFELHKGVASAWCQEFGVYHSGTNKGCMQNHSKLGKGYVRFSFFFFFFFFWDKLRFCIEGYLILFLFGFEWSLNQRVILIISRTLRKLLDLVPYWSLPLLCFIFFRIHPQRQSLTTHSQAFKSQVCPLNARETVTRLYFHLGLPIFSR